MYMRGNNRILLGVATLAAIAAIATFGAAAQNRAADPPDRTAAAPKDLTAAPMFDNASFSVIALTFRPGYQQDPHSLPPGADDQVVVQITPGRMSGNIDGKVEMGAAGKAWMVPKAPSKHAFGNLDTHPITVVIVRWK
jgi:quercetin dioxygenase-like cupin family protein